MLFNKMNLTLLIMVELAVSTLSVGSSSHLVGTLSSYLSDVGLRAGLFPYLLLNSSLLTIITLVSGFDCILQRLTRVPFFRQV